MIPGLDVQRTLSGLKDFQRRSVDYVFQRMFLDTEPTYRFLVADEVGLGKTIVARGIIARTLEHLQDSVERIDIVYVCSNAAIARQNINKLNVLGDAAFTSPTRLTLLPTQLHDLEGNKVNFVSFTPGTTFDLRSSGGIVEERVVLFRMLRDQGYCRETPLLNALQCGAGKDNFRHAARKWKLSINDRVRAEFLAQLADQRELVDRITDMADRFHRYRRNPADEDSRFRYRVIGDLRRVLAHVCVDALEPDLVIMDEFQRFKDLLRPDSEAGELADTLMNHITPEEQNVRVLLLSATPYKSYTTYREEDEDHYADFLHTVGFLHDDATRTEELDRGLRRYRAALYALEGWDGLEALDAARREVQRNLISVMSRTERVAHMDDPDAMVRSRVVDAPIAPEDLEQARLVDEVSGLVEAQDPIEYWKSAPHLLQFMREYQLKRNLRKEGSEPNPVLAKRLRSYRSGMLRERHVEQYEKLPEHNGRLRALVRDAVDNGAWRLLWVPASLPYMEPGGAYASARDITKALVFSAWTVVPDVVSALVSYEVERRILETDADRPAYSDLTRKRRGLLRYPTESDGRPRAMNNLAGLYPSPTLARLVDPLAMALESGAAVPLADARDRAKAVIGEALRRTGEWPKTSRDGTVDARWYWVALAFLDGDNRQLVRWVEKNWTAAVVQDGSDSHDGFAEHVAQFYSALVDSDFTLMNLGGSPSDLVEVLADLALGGPAVCALRALRRIAGPEIDPGALLDAAAVVAEGFRTMFNVPETQGILRSDDDSAYWRAVAAYGVEGNLQAVLDEYVHVLHEWLGLGDHEPEQSVAGVAAGMAEALSLRTATVSADEIGVTRTDRVKFRRFSFRSRYALRFTDFRDESGALARIDTVRKAFNSPFRPFVLASTSVGQEGLDFHPYCHTVYHWNLPSNPVDLEQREGRVHRYKGHAVRKNVASRHGLAGLPGNLDGGDPWRALFDCAERDREPGMSDLYPYWVYPLEDGAFIERRVPILPLSREEGQLERLKRSLALYRMVFGQPRQEDLLAHLAEKIEDPDLLKAVCEHQITLEAPDVEVTNG